MTETPSAEQIAEFQRDGAIVLRGLFTDWVERLRVGVERNMAAPSADVRIYRNPDGSGLFFGDYCNWDRIPEYRAFVFDSDAGCVAARLMGSRTARLFHEHVLVKEPGTDLPTPWHHDQPYYNVDGNQNVSLWLALDPVPPGVTVEFVAGSHQWGRWFRPERFNRTALYEDDHLQPVPDIEGHRANFTLLSWPLEPGDCVAFHFLTLHSAPGTKGTATRRRGFSSRWIGDDARFAVRKGPTSPPFRAVTLRPGAPMDAPEFPLVFGGS
jgi:ectoine hydroxylase-related dioxygenase (phytanoyl-CoA dioxygenase family)